MIGSAAMEADLLNGVAWLDQIYSESVAGLSSILLVFEQGTMRDLLWIVGASGALQSVLAIVKKVAKSNTTILIRGESGVGKELLAQNADKPFVPASVTKIVTAWLALEVLGGDRFQLGQDGHGLVNWG